MKRVVGFSGYYITKSGIVWSVRPKSGRGGHGGPRVLTIKEDRDGYLRVMLQHGTGAVRRGIHQLLLATFVGPCPNGMQCRHLNGDRKDNRLENLCWGTPKENSKDKEGHGRVPRGEKHRRSKLTERQVIEIIHRLENGEEGKQLAEEFRVSQQTMSSIRTGAGWKHLQR